MFNFLVIDVKSEDSIDLYDAKSTHEVTVNDELNKTYLQLQSLNAGAGDAIIQQSNYPLICEKFIDPITQTEKVLLVVNLPGGIQNIQMELNKDGTHVIITYVWPISLYKLENLFKSELTTEESYHHAKIIAAQNGLKKMKTNLEIAPINTIKIKLATRVQTAISTWTKKDVLGPDGYSQQIIAEFQGFSTVCDLTKRGKTLS